MKLVVLTGAGISAESGMSTFRDADGLWNNYRVEDVATPEGFLRNPQFVLDFYNDLHHSLQSLKPNYGHIGLAELEEFFDVRVITQNVDNLHEAAGSSNVLHLHGELTKYASVKNPDRAHDWPFGTDLHLGDKADDGSQIRPFIVWFGEAKRRPSGSGKPTCSWSLALLLRFILRPVCSAMSPMRSPFSLLTQNL